LKKHKKLNLKKQTVAHLEKRFLGAINGGKDVPPSDTCWVSELYTGCGCTQEPSCLATCFPMNTCHTCPAETNPGPA
jgi:natural product precursor